MNTVRLVGTTSLDGTLSLRVPLGTPSTEYEVIVVAQATLPTRPPADPWARTDEIHARLAAAGRDYGDSTQEIREDRDR